MTSCSLARRDYRFHCHGLADGLLTKTKNNSSVIRPKGEYQNGCFKKTKYVKFSEKQTFITPYGKFGKFGFVFLKYPI